MDAEHIQKTSRSLGQCLCLWVFAEFGEIKVGMAKLGKALNLLLESLKSILYILET
jgi:hypothetical protein